MSTVVLYIAGTGRSGSTVLANILGEVDGVFTAGEVRYLWQRGLREGRLCGCGVPVRECPVWGDVLTRTGQLDDAGRVDGIVSMLQRTGRIRNLPAILAGTSGRVRSRPLARDARRIAPRWQASTPPSPRSREAASSSTPRSSRRTRTSLPPHPGSTCGSCT